MKQETTAKFGSISFHSKRPEEKGDEIRNLWQAFASVNFNSEPDIRKFVELYNKIPPGDYPEGFKIKDIAKNYIDIQKIVLAIVEAIRNKEKIPRKEWDIVQNYLKENTHINYHLEDFDTIIGQKRQVLFESIVCDGAIAAIYYSLSLAILDYFKNWSENKILGNFDRCSVCQRLYHYTIRRSDDLCSDYCADIARKRKQNIKRQGNN